MAYKRRRYYKKKRMGRWGNYKAGLGQLWKDVKLLKSLINVEHKYLDVSNSTTYDNTIGSELLNGMGQGTTSITRTGDTVKWTSLLIRMSFNLHASATQSRIRVLIYRDKQTNGALIADDNILASSTNILAPRNLDYDKRLKVYKDFVVMINTDRPEKQLKIYIGKLKFHTRYVDGNATISSISTNSMCIAIMSDEATNMPTVGYYCRMRFIDN